LLVSVKYNSDGFTVMKMEIYADISKTFDNLFDLQGSIKPSDIINEQVYSK
jgi:hypothetical protein